MIFACNGAECWKSYKSCVAARAQGFTQVYWFRGGFPEWVAKGYPVESVGAERRADALSGAAPRAPRETLGPRPALAFGPARRQYDCRSRTIPDPYKEES